MYQNPRLLKLQASTAVFIATLVISFALFAKTFSPMTITDANYFMILLMWPGVFVFGFAFLQFIEVPEFLPPKDDRGGGGGDNDPSPKPFPRPSRPVRRGRCIAPTRAVAATTSHRRSEPPWSRSGSRL